MGTYMDRCKELRADTTRHYGCSQAVFIPMAEAMGMDTETAFQLSAHFRAGMLQGEVCGAVTGALMALGLAKAGPKQATELLDRVRANHQGTLDCKTLLERWTAQGNTNRKPHCDGMCLECMALVEELLGEAEQDK